MTRAPSGKSMSRIAEAARSAAASSTAYAVRFRYTNYRGETAERHATPISLRFGVSEWHRKGQWLMRAFDHDKQEIREFALLDCDFTDQGVTG